MAKAKHSFEELPAYLLEKSDPDRAASIASCLYDSGCVDSSDCQSDSGSCTSDHGCSYDVGCSRDTCSDCSDCSDCADSGVATSISIASLSASYDSITMECDVTVRYASSSLYVVLRLNGTLTAQSSTFSLSAGGSRSVTVTKSGLQPDTYYSVEAILYNSSGQVVKDTGGISTEIRPPLTSGTLTVTNITATSITVQLAQIPDATSYLIAYRPSTSSTQLEIQTTSTTYTIEGLTPKTTYYLNYRGKNSGGTGPYMSSSVTATTKGEVEPWDWNISNGAATIQQTQLAYQALKNQGVLTNFSYLVWNDMVDKVAQIIDARGVSWHEDYGSIDETKMTSIDKILTAMRFNALWWNLSHFVTVSGAKKVSPGDVVLGSYFTALTDSMNKSIP